jgi:hypothetical protein
MHLYLGGAQRAVQKETVLHGVFSVPGRFCAPRLSNFAVEKLAAARALVTPTDQEGRFARNLFGRVLDLGVSLLHTGGAKAVDKRADFQAEIA